MSGKVHIQRPRASKVLFYCKNSPIAINYPAPPAPPPLALGLFKYTK